MGQTNWLEENLLLVKPMLVVVQDHLSPKKVGFFQHHYKLCLHGKNIITSASMFLSMYLNMRVIIVHIKTGSPRKIEQVRIV